MGWAGTSSIDLQRLTRLGQERGERFKTNATCKVEKPGGTRLVRPGQWWWMENKRVARKFLSSTPISERTENLRKQTGWCTNTIWGSMRKRKKESLWCQRYSIRHSQGSAIGQIEVQQLVKEVENLTTVVEGTVEVEVVLLRKLLLTEMRCLLLLVSLQWQVSLIIIPWIFNS